MESWTLFWLLAALIVPYVAGKYWAQSIRLPDSGWKVGLILSVTAVSLFVVIVDWPPNLGVDLSGGVNLIYEIDPEQTVAIAPQQNGSQQQNGSGDQVDMDAMITALQRRINPGGVREIIVRKFGDQQVEIIIPDASDAELAQIKARIVQAGLLKFRIVANRFDHPTQIALAQAPQNQGQRYVKNDAGETVAEWVQVAVEEPVRPGEPPKYKVDPSHIPGSLTREPREGVLEILVVEPPPGMNVVGSDLKSTSPGIDEYGKPKIDFTLKPDGAVRFGTLTKANEPDLQSQHYRHLGIVMDNELLSAPTINSQITDRGQITGQFTQEEVDFLVNILRAGQLPAVLKEEPISENRISALLGQDTIEQGSRAIGLSFVAVLVFMVIYYRFAGVVACCALLMNMVLILALMMLINAAFTLPGLAGLVLTIGMSVDSNVLIYERMREELSRGTSMRMTVRNGFSRATTTIIDSQLTTLITAIVLYGIATDAIRGFAIALILGIVTSLFTAIFFGHVVFDIAERKRWLTTVKMLQLVGETKFNFLRYRWPAIGFSVVLLILGLVATIIRGPQLLDIDFVGGSSVQVVLKPDHPLPVDEVRERVADMADSVSVTEVESTEHPAGTVFRIDTNIRSDTELREQLRARFKGTGGESLLQFHTVSFTAPKEAESPAPSVAATGAAGASETPEASETTEAAQTPEKPETGAAPASRSWVQSRLQFDETINGKVVEDELSQAAEDVGLSLPPVRLTAGGEDPNASFADEWNIQLASSQQDATRILDRLVERIGDRPVYLAASTFGGAVAESMRRSATVALLVCVIGVIGYIWVRFQHFTFGVAPVVAVVHDVLVAVAVIALSTWLAEPFGFLLVEEFRISMPVVAALLTILGYSLNDTIVIFDRIREIRGRSPNLTPKMVNDSLNQTLSRTLLTSLTTLIVVVVLYALGGSGIHSFAFTLIVGIIAGTYSTVYIACPVLLWLHGEKAAVEKKPEKVTVQQ